MPPRRPSCGWRRPPHSSALEAFRARALHYEGQFDIAPGKYRVRVVFSSGADSFGKLEQPLEIEPWDGQRIGISGVAFSREYHPVSEIQPLAEAEMLEGRTPLIAGGFGLVPSAASRFSSADHPVLYVEVYEPLLLRLPAPQVTLQVGFINPANGQRREAVLDATPAIQAGNPVIALPVQLPTAVLGTGRQRAELKAVDSAGNSSTVRSVDFEVE